MKLYFWPAVGFLALLPVNAAAQSQCDALLEHGINNITKTFSAEHAVAYKWHSNCGIDYLSESDRRTKRANLEIYGQGSGRSRDSSQSMRESLNEWCDINEDFAKDKAVLVTEVQSLSTQALQSYEKCQEMSQKDIEISVTPMQQNAEFVKIEIDSNHDGDLKYLGLQTQNYTCTESMVLYTDGQSVDVNSQPSIRNANIHIDCIRDKPEVEQNNALGTGKIIYEEAYISVNTSGPGMPVSFPKVVSEYVVTPPGAILGFNTSECPAGWNAYTEAEGRFLIGSGNNNDSNKDDLGATLTSKKVGSVGGAEKHTLTVAEMPAHTHGHYTRRTMRRRGDHGAAEHHHTYQNQTSSAGGGQPHNNMPPYLAVKYCERQGENHSVRRE